jgi:hypothetical protein
MYDYVIVGAGSAGCVLAARLSEDRDVRAAMIEAGPPDSESVIHMPWTYLQLFESRFDWGPVERARAGTGLPARTAAAGACAGGIELAERDDLHARQRADYDGWAAMGFGDWGYEDVLPYFRRAEDNERGESYYHGVGGLLAVSDGRSMHPLVGACIEAALQTGIAPTGDYNGPAQEGAGWFQFTQRNDATPVPCGHPVLTARRSGLYGWAGYGNCPNHSRWYWGSKLLFICTCEGTVTGFGLANPKLFGEREQARLMLERQPVNRPAPGTAIVTDKGLPGEETEAFFAAPDLGLEPIRPARKDEKEPRCFPNWLRQKVEAIIWTLKHQLGLERHGSRVPAGAVGPHRAAPARTQRLHLAQLADRRAGQALPHRVRSLSCA